MSVLFIGFLTCLIIFLTVVIVGNVNDKQQVRRLTMQVTPLNRGERSERRVVLELLRSCLKIKVNLGSHTWSRFGSY